MKVALVAVCLTGLLVGCSSPEAAAPEESTPPSTPVPTTSTPAPSVQLKPLAERCGDVQSARPTTPRVIKSSTGEQLYAVGAGTGRTGVVLVHGSGSRGICNWANELGWMSQAGLNVVGYDQSCIGESTCQGEARPVQDLLAVVADLRRRGASKVVVVGASAGGALPLVAAVQPRSGISSVVSLSAVLEAPVDDVRASEAVPSIRVPVLYVLAADDTASSPAEVRSFEKRTRGSRLVLLPSGSGHAQAVLYDSSGSRPSSFRQTFLDFLR